MGGQAAQLTRWPRPFCDAMWRNSTKPDLDEVLPASGLVLESIVHTELQLAWAVDLAANEAK